MMIRRLRGPILLGVVTIFALLLLTSDRDDDFQDTFKIDAVYESGYVEITYVDKSQKTDTAILQVLGMKESFQKTFQGSEFAESVPFSDVPTYGWKAHPIVVDVEHADFGHVQLKTEVRMPDEPAPPVIYSRP